MVASGVYWEKGREGERMVRRWLQEQGFYVISTADIATNGAPVAEGLASGIILPDLLASIRGHSRWVEVKLKSAAPMYYKLGYRQHGIETRNWHHYLYIADSTGVPGYLAIWQADIEQVLLAPLKRLEKMCQFGEMDGEPHVFWPQSLFDFYDGPVTISRAEWPAPLPPENPRFPSPRPPPGRQARQLPLSLFDTEEEDI